MTRFLLVCLGGAAGTGVRYLVNQWLGRSPGGFPYATLLVNIAGCLLLAFVMELALSVATFPVNLRVALTAGFMGGLTTYSTFNYETSKLLDEGATITALANIGVTLVGCFAAGYLGLLLARAMVGD